MPPEGVGGSFPSAAAISDFLIATGTRRQQAHL